MAAAALTRAAFACTLVAVLAGCERSGAAALPADPVARGRRLYELNCVVCHHADPAQAGAIGPEVAGASLELLTARVLRGAYPPGYVPKRSTNAMVPLPWLEGSIGDLAAYLQSVRR